MWNLATSAGQLDLAFTPSGTAGYEDQRQGALHFTAYGIDLLAYRLESFGPRDIEQARTIIQRHSDLNIGLADASIVVLANRRKTDLLLTLDEPHFRVLPGPQGKPFLLSPMDLG